MTATNFLSCGGILNISADQRVFSLLDSFGLTISSKSAMWRDKRLAMQAQSRKAGDTVLVWGLADGCTGNVQFMDRT